MAELREAAVAATAEPLSPATPGEAPEALFPKLKPGPPGPGRSATSVAENQRARILSSMLQIAGERGYEAVTARELAAMAGVSTRTYYERFGSKEECFLRTHELVTRKLLRRLAASELGASDWRQQVLLVFEAFVGELGRDPRAARLFLIESEVAGAGSQDQVRCVVRAFEERLAAAFAAAPDGAGLPRPLLAGIAAGTVCVTRSKLQAGYAVELPWLTHRLAEWALGYRSVVAEELATLDRQCARGARPVPVPAPPAPSSRQRRGARAPLGDRALILAAATRLLAVDGFEDLTVERIRAAAGLPRRRFAACFDGVEDCVLAVLEDRTLAALARARRAEASGSSWAGGLYWTLAALSAEVAADPVLASFCCSGELCIGARGADARGRLVTSLARHLREAASPTGELEPAVLEASVGAACELLRREVAAHGPERAPAAATLTYLVAAPVVGSEEALNAIRTGLRIDDGASEGQRAA